MGRSRLVSTREEAFGVDMSSLVDLSFLLLVFFLVTTTLLAKEQDVTMSVPVPGASGGSNPITIRVERDGRVVLHPGRAYQEEVASAGEGHELPGLKERLSILKQSGGGVQLDIAGDASYQRFVDVLNCLRGEGWEKIGITRL